MKIIDLEDIPEPTNGKGSLRIEIEEFLATKGAKAAELRAYNNSNTARSTVTRLNQWAEEEDLPFEALSRGGTVYIRKV